MKPVPKAQRARGFPHCKLGRRILRPDAGHDPRAAASGNRVDHSAPFAFLPSRRVIARIRPGMLLESAGGVVDQQGPVVKGVCDRAVLGTLR